MGILACRSCSGSCRFSLLEATFGLALVGILSLGGNSLFRHLLKAQGHSNLSISRAAVRAEPRWPAAALPVSPPASTPPKPSALATSLPGLYVMDPSASGAVKLAGTYCGSNLIVNSRSETAVQIFGASGCSSDLFSGLYIVGNYRISPGVTASVGNFPLTNRPRDSSSDPYGLTGRPPFPDPLSALPMPDQGGLPVAADVPLHIDAATPADKRILSPGIYRGGIFIDGPGLGSRFTVVLTPGIYFIDGGGLHVKGAYLVDLGWPSGPPPDYAGELIYNTGTLASEGIEIKRSYVGLFSRVSGPFRGMIFAQARASAAPVEIDGAYVNLWMPSSRGNPSIRPFFQFYAPSAPLRIGNGGSLQNYSTDYLHKSAAVFGTVELSKNSALYF